MLRDSPKVHVANGPLQDVVYTANACQSHAKAPALDVQALYQCKEVHEKLSVV